MRKQILAFCQEYIKHPENNGAEAARKAGYSSKTARTQASKLLTRLDVQEYLAKFLQKQEERVEIDADWVLSKLKTIAERCMQEEAVTSKGEATGEFKFDAAGANKALELIGRNKKMFTDKIEQDTTLTVVRKQYKAKEND